MDKISINCIILKFHQWERVEKIKPKDKNNNNSENEINNYKLLLSY